MLNIDKTLRANGITRIQSDAITELHSYLTVALERMATPLQQLAKNKNRTTIYVEDIIEYFGFAIHDIENLKQLLYEQTQTEGDE